MIARKEYRTKWEEEQERKRREEEERKRQEEEDRLRREEERAFCIVPSVLTVLSVHTPTFTLLEQDERRKVEAEELAKLAEAERTRIIEEDRRRQFFFMQLLSVS